MHVKNSRPAAIRTESSRTEPSLTRAPSDRPNSLLTPIKKGDSHARAQAGQLRDISEGVRNGSITSREAEKLLEQQKKLADATARAKADGVVTKDEARELALLRFQAQQSINKATHNRERDVFAPFDQTAQRQADQIDRIANGRQNGTITHREAGGLLGQQADIADARQNVSSPLSHWMVDHQLDEAAQDIRHHSRPGTQRPPLDLGPGSPLPGPFPFPRPPIDIQPLPLPFPRPPVDIQPLPLPIRPPIDLGPRPLPEPQPFPVIKPWQGVLV